MRFPPPNQIPWKVEAMGGPKRGSVQETRKTLSQEFLSVVPSLEGPRDLCGWSKPGIPLNPKPQTLLLSIAFVNAAIPQLLIHGTISGLYRDYIGVI